MSRLSPSAEINQAAHGSARWPLDFGELSRAAASRIERFGLVGLLHSRSRKRGSAGFTLVEILIVVVILGILATIVIPQFSNASIQARENTLKDDLRYLRIQLQVFKAQHRDVPPGYPGGSITATPTEQAFLDQMTANSNEDCGTNSTATATFKFGPYISKMPQNPVNGSSEIKMIDNSTPLPLPAAADANAYGWIYKASTQEIIANLTGNDSTGMPYSGY